MTTGAVEAFGTAFIIVINKTPEELIFFHFQSGEFLNAILLDESEVGGKTGRYEIKESWYFAESRILATLSHPVQSTH